MIAITTPKGLTILLIALVILTVICITIGNKSGLVDSAQEAAVPTVDTVNTMQQVTPEVIVTVIPTTTPTPTVNLKLQSLIAEVASETAQTNTAITNAWQEYAIASKAMLIACGKDNTGKTIDYNKFLSSSCGVAMDYQNSILSQLVILYGGTPHSSPTNVPYNNSSNSYAATNNPHYYNYNTNTDNSFSQPTFSPVENHNSYTQTINNSSADSVPTPYSYTATVKSIESIDGTSYTQVNDNTVKAKDGTTYNRYGDSPFYTVQGIAPNANDQEVIIVPQ